MVSRKVPSEGDVTNALELKNFFAVPDSNSEDILAYVGLHHTATSPNRKVKALLPFNC